MLMDKLFTALPIQNPDTPPRGRLRSAGMAHSVSVSIIAVLARVIMVSRPGYVNDILL